MYQEPGVLKEYKVTGRSLPTNKVTRPPIYRMSIFAKNEVAAKSKYWYFLRKMKKVKKTKGEILEIREVFAKKPRTVKNVGIWLRLETRTKTLNMYREYRDSTINGAVNRCYSDLAGIHRARANNVQVINTEIIPASACKKKRVKMYHDSKLEFPHFHVTSKDKMKSLFSAVRPNTIV
ncbi:60S ribosomal protein L18a [Thelohanellus kitauei]|uniref:60S ribosomal protein L18a n=1 Tax=Thelohanellus kitauei TaxID=669202 RepID=A0A0C2N836_THEKT|nr:60S ribosomal protein L18a [Thelohanellus kitauei]